MGARFVRPTRKRKGMNRLVELALRCSDAYPRKLGATNRPLLSLDKCASEESGKNCCSARGAARGALTFKLSGQLQWNIPLSTVLPFLSESIAPSSITLAVALN